MSFNDPQRKGLSVLTVTQEAITAQWASTQLLSGKAWAQILGIAFKHLILTLHLPHPVPNK